MRDVRNAPRKHAPRTAAGPVAVQIRRAAGSRTGRIIALGTWIALAFALVMPNPANAYIDPATTSYLIQVVSGLVITLSVAFGVFFRRIVLWLMTERARMAAAWVYLTSLRQGTRQLGQERRGARDPETDDNLAAAADSKVAILHLDHDPRYSRLAPEVESAARGPLIATGSAARISLGHTAGLEKPDQMKQDSVTAREPGPEGPGQAPSSGTAHWGDWREYLRRAMLGVPVVVSSGFLLLVFGPLDLYLQNADEFPFTETEMIKPFLLPSLETCALAVCCLVLLRGRMLDLVVSLILGITLAAWVQGTFLNIGYGELDGATIQWGNYGWLAVIDTAAWVVMIGAPVLLLFMNRRLWKIATVVLPAALVGSLSFALVAELAESGTAARRASGEDVDFLGPEVPTYDGVFTASSTANQYIIVLDMMDQELVKEIQAEEPDFFSSHLDGFTQFDAHVSNYFRTLPSAANILTGQDYQFDEPLDQYFSRAYRDGDFLPLLRTAGYSTNIYATNLYSYYAIDDIRDLADNVAWSETEPHGSSMTEGMLRLDGFRYAPHILKPVFWTTTDEFQRISSTLTFGSPFNNDNFAFHKLLRREGFTLDGSQPRFSYIHLDGAHYPFIMDRNAEEVPLNWDNQAEQAHGVFLIMFDFIDELKRVGAYQDASIVITADHGTVIRGGDLPRLTAPRLTSLFVKPAGAAGTPLAHSTAPTQVENVRALLLQDAGVLPADGPPTVFEIDEDADAPRDIFHRRGANVNEGVIDHWQIIGDARDWSNWHFIDQRPTEYWG